MKARKIVVYFSILASILSILTRLTLLTLRIRVHALAQPRLQSWRFRRKAKAYIPRRVLDKLTEAYRDALERSLHQLSAFTAPWKLPQREAKAGAAGR